MAPLHEPLKVVTFVSALLALFLNVQDALQKAVEIHTIQCEDLEAPVVIDDCHDSL
jgi:hypothetical protein